MSNVSQRDDDVHNPKNHDHGLRCVFQSDNIEEKPAYCNMIRNTEVFSSENFQYIKRLYEIFWHEMAQKSDLAINWPCLLQSHELTLLRDLIVVSTK